MLSRELDVPDADVCVIAGELCRGIANGVHWLAGNIVHLLPCVYIAGNHEFYKGSIEEGLEEGRAAAARFPNMHFLENDSVVIDRIRFVGASLWTDYRVMGLRKVAMHHARERVNDYRLIAKRQHPWERFIPETALRMHAQSRRFIEASLDDRVKTVVVTHHLPHPLSIAPRFSGDLLNAAFASDLGDVIEAGRPALWVHGHTHNSCDYEIGDTRFVCNPRGYGNENLIFDPMLVLEI